MGPDTDLVMAEIRRIVADAIREGGVIYARACAASILQTHPNCGLAETELADRVMMAAAAARVPVLFGGGGSPESS